MRLSAMAGIAVLAMAVGACSADLGSPSPYQLGADATRSGGDTGPADGPSDNATGITPDAGHSDGAADSDGTIEAGLADARAEVGVDGANDVGRADAAVDGSADMSVGPVHFADYDEHHLSYYVLVRPDGTRYSATTIFNEKRYDWFVPPAGDGGSGQWYWFRTVYEGASNCDPAIDQVQVGHRYVAENGTLWELGGQPDTECENYAVNVYADADGEYAPLLISPATADSGDEHFSNLWIADPPSRAPAGYPSSNADSAKRAYSQARIEAILPSLTVAVQGHGSKTYYNVVQVFWRHGWEHESACASIPPDFQLPGFNLYGHNKWYAKHMPDIGQQGGPIKVERLWYCHNGTGLAPSTFYRKWW